MSNIKAIETSYKGHRFRSRLEARWAIFFDALEIPWEYEKEGYALPSGPYLPDFWLPYNCGQPGCGHWVEIKPCDPSPLEMKKLADLARLTGHRAYCFCGQPWPGEHRIHIWQHHHNGAPESIPLAMDCEISEVDHRVDGDSDDEVESFGIMLIKNGTGFSFPSDSFGYKTGDLASAFTAARSARFEHGEQG